LRMENVGRLEPDASGTDASTGLLLEDWAKLQGAASDRNAATANSGEQQQEVNFITRIQIPITSLYHCERDCRFRSMSVSSDEPIAINGRELERPQQRIDSRTVAAQDWYNLARDQNSDLIRTSSPKAPLWVGS
jgi:hypothetical protein